MSGRPCRWLASVVPDHPNAFTVEEAGQRCRTTSRSGGCMMDRKGDPQWVE